MEFSGQIDETISVRSDTGKTVLYIVLCALVAVVFWYVPKKDVQFAILICNLMAVFFLLLAAVFVFRLFRPMRLILSPEGIDFSTGLRRFRYDWADVVDVSYRKFYDGRANHYSTILSLRPGHGGTSVKDDVLNIQGRGWEVDPEDLTSFIKEARERWAGPFHADAKYGSK